MALVDRAQRILTTPAAEWPVIAQEPATPASLYSGYIVPLAAIPPIGSFLSTILFLHRGIFAAAVISLVSFVAALVSVYLVALIAEYVAPSFGAAKDRIAALKWVAYSYTASWVAGIALLIPFIGAFIAVLGSLYSLYLLFLGAVPVMRVPQEKAIGYVAVVLVAAIVLGVFVSIIVGILFTVLAAGTMLTSGIH